MASTGCEQHHRQVELALAEQARLRQPPGDPAIDLAHRQAPTMGGDLGSRFYETLGRQEAADRNYRTAVRRLAECLRSQRLAAESD